MTSPNVVQNGVVTNNPTTPHWGPENYSGLAENAKAAQEYIQKNFGIDNIGGWRASGSVAASDHPKGKALDVMVTPNHRSPEKVALGNKVADFFRTNPNAFGTKYVIWRGQIDNMKGKGWEPYTHPSGSDDTLMHYDHVHISFLAGNGKFTGMGPASSPGDNPVSMAGNLAQGGDFKGLLIIGIIGILGFVIVTSMGLS